MHKAHRPLANEEREGNKVTGLAQGIDEMDHLDIVREESSSPLKNMKF